MQSQYQEHIDKIAAFMGCVVVQKHDLRGMMYVEEEPPRIEGPLITTYVSKDYPNMQSKYIALLHELGHVHYGHTQGRPPYQNKQFYFDNGVLNSEAQAWDYALENSIDEILPETFKFMRKCFWSYIRHAKESANKKIVMDDPGRNFVEFVFDKPNELVLSTYERIGGNRLDILLTPINEEPCNHHHEDLLQVAKFPAQKIKKALAIASWPLDDTGQVIIDNTKIVFWNKEQLAAERKKDIEYWVPLYLKERKGRRLLRHHLNYSQWKTYRQHGYFYVYTNNRAFKVYGYYGVEELDSDGVGLISYCLHGKSNELPQSDVLIIQKLMIETDLEEFERVANKTVHTTEEMVEEDNSEIIEIFKEQGVTDIEEMNRVLNSVVSNKFVLETI